MQTHYIAVWKDGQYRMGPLAFSGRSSTGELRILYSDPPYEDEGAEVVLLMNGPPGEAEIDMTKKIAAERCSGRNTRRGVGNVYQQQTQLETLTKRVLEVSYLNGWDICWGWPYQDCPDRVVRARHISSTLCLIHSELSEALEAVRKDDKVNFAEELADTVIRVLELAGGLGVELGTEIERKIETNRGRGGDCETGGSL